MVHQVVDGEVAGRRVPGYQRIAIECERGFRRGEDAAKVAVLLVEHFLHLFANHGMSEGLIAGRHAPVVGVAGIVLKVQQFIQCLAKAGAGPREDVREIRETRDAAFECRRVTDVKDHSRRNGGCGILPVALLRAVLAGAHDHVGDVLGVAHIARRE